jgi:hypothetical protein
LDAGKIHVSVHFLGGFQYGISKFLNHRRVPTVTIFRVKNWHFRVSEESYWKAILEYVSNSKEEIKKFANKYHKSNLFNSP